MQIYKSQTATVIFGTLIVVSSLVGWSIPGFYEWTDSDQSRPSPLLWKVPLGTAISFFAFCIALCWLPIAVEHSDDSPRTWMGFSKRTLLLLGTFVALATVFFAWFPVVVSGCVLAAMLVCFVAFFVRHPMHRLELGTFIACMYLPYAWLLGYSELDRILPMIAVMFTAMPAFVPSLVVSRGLGLHFQELHWLAFLFAALEIAWGMWMIWLGPKRTIAYLLLVLLLSALGSLVLLQLCLA